LDVAGQDAAGQDVTGQDVAGQDVAGQTLGAGADVVPLGLSRVGEETSCRWRRLGLSETRSRMSPESCRG
jgi:hypothetical protein